MLAKTDGGEEKVLFSARVVKFNKRDKTQIRCLLITDKALYNLKPAHFSKFQRRVPIDKIAGITASKTSDEFVLHIPDEYDYRYASDRRDQVVNLLQKVHTQITRKKLVSAQVDAAGLGRFAVTKARALAVPRKIQTVKKFKHYGESLDEKESKEELAGEDILGVEGMSLDNVGLADFQFIKVLGRGAFGKVVLARKLDINQVFAIKILKKSLLSERDQLSWTRSWKQILEHVHHPFIMHLRWAFQTRSRIFLVMDFLRGGEVFSHLKQKRRFTEEEARVIAAELALALGHLHALNFVYRDLKPENVLSKSDPSLFLPDELCSG